MNKGLLVIFSGPSGCGKGTILDLLKKTRENLFVSVSATTRIPREGETHGKDYFFISKDEFESLIAQDAMLEYANYCGNYYGTPKSTVEEKLAAGIDVILEIEVQGALKIKDKCPDAVFIFVVPPNMAELERRLNKRGTESADTIQERLRAARNEIKEYKSYDYIVISDHPKLAAARIESVIEAERIKLHRMSEYMETV